MSPQKITLISILCLGLTQTSLAAKRSSLIFGLESGGIIKHSTSSLEEDGQGIELGVKLLTTRYWKDWDVDLGGGWRINQLREDQVTVSTKSFFAELAVREKLSRKLSVGPMLSALVGRDVSFSDFGTNSDNKSLALFAGAKALYEVPIYQTDSRVGLQIQTDLNIGSRQITQVQMVLEIDWPFSGRRSVASLTESDESRRGTFNLSNSGLRFGLDSAHLSYHSRVLLEKISSELETHQEDWESISIHGHSDRQGDATHNLMLSRNRAMSVQKVFTDKGLSQSAVRSTGHGAEFPLDHSLNESAHAKNRRVELKVHGLEQGSPLEKRLKSLLR